MFTGIVQGLCPVKDVRSDAEVVTLAVGLGSLAAQLVEGASVAINGVCLTAVALKADVVEFQAIPQTLEHTNLSTLSKGDRVNVERSFKVGDEIGGHILSGHVAGMAEISDLRERGGSKVMTLNVAPEHIRFLFDKGFVALDGASLTVSSVDRARSTIEVNLIPETLARTTFGFKRVGESVNVEVDATTHAIVETVERLLADQAWRKSVGLGR